MKRKINARKIEVQYINSSKITHHPHLTPPKPVQQAYLDTLASLGNHSYHHLTATSSYGDSLAKTEYLQLGTPFAVKGAHFS